MRLTASLVSLLICGMLAGCGGGGDGGSGGGSNNDTSSLFAVSASNIAVTSGSTTKSWMSGEAGEFISAGASGNCIASSGTFNVKETANTIVYNADTVPDAVLTSVAQYADASIQTLRARYAFPATIGFDGAKIRVCASANNQGNNAAGINTLAVGTQNTGKILAQLIHHEMTHLVQAQALQCRTYQYRFERWLTEGMALYMGQQDNPKASELDSLQAKFTSVTTATPFGDTNNTTYPDFGRYPGYRLAFDTFLGEHNKTDVDVFKFLKAYGATKGCPADATLDWKAEFDGYFGTDLRGSGVLGTTFWKVAPRYAG